jgi:hypothetical protein
MGKGDFPGKIGIAGLDMAASRPRRKARAGEISRHPTVGNSICENLSELARFALAGIMMSIDLRGA